MAYSARPDGSGSLTSRGPAGGALLCYSGTLICPSCNRQIGTIHGKGAFFVMCRNRVPNPGRASGGTRWCGQHVYVDCTSQNVCAVVPISKEQFQQYRDDSRDSWKIMDELGVLAGSKGRAA